MDAPSPTAAHEFAFSLSISCDPAFAETVRALVNRAGALAGCTDDAGGRLGACVEGVFEALIAGGVTHSTDVAFDVHGSSRLVTVDVQCPESCRPPLAEALEQSGAAPTLRAMVDRLECGESKGRTFCRVTQLVHA